MMDAAKLAGILTLHRKWLDSKPDGERANLSGTNLSEADLSEANLRGANLSGANLRGTNLSWANLSEADLSEANLRGTNLSEADLSEANLRGTDLSEANLRGTDLSGANLRGTNLSGADLRWTDLSWADLSEADLSEANLRGTDLSWANLSGANIRGTDLSEANLSGANLSGANLENVKTPALDATFVAELARRAAAGDLRRQQWAGLLSLHSGEYCWPEWRKMAMQLPEAVDWLLDTVLAPWPKAAAEARTMLQLVHTPQSTQSAPGEVVRTTPALQPVFPAEWGVVRTPDGTA